MNTLYVKQDENAKSVFQQVLDEAEERKMIHNNASATERYLRNRKLREEVKAAEMAEIAERRLRYRNRRKSASQSGSFDVKLVPVESDKLQKKG